MRVLSWYPKPQETLQLVHAVHCPRGCTKNSKIVIFKSSQLASKNCIAYIRSIQVSLCYETKTAFIRCRHILKTVKNVTDRPPFHRKTAHFLPPHFENDRF